jgi:DNA-binding response OmpR family regulator
MTEKQVILLVEDEPLISELLVDQLAEAGFAVLSESNGDSAIATFNAQANEVVALITDVRLGRGRPGGT